MAEPYPGPFQILLVRSLSYNVDRGFLAFIIIDHLSVGLSFDDWSTAFIVAGLVGLFNVLFWPMLARVLLPFMVFTVGIGALLLNGFFIWLAGGLVDGFTIGGLP
ncbi:phage holin family protein [Methanobacterium petrolearium]|uniref:phage holin family protein n=1 Tax=Methanobacterium petrolearium TaxID=710190 RepID=UPI003081D184